jgi:ribosomal protein L2
MNPVDHPHGGRTKSNSPERSPWGWIAKKNK